MSTKQRMSANAAYGRYDDKIPDDLPDELVEASEHQSLKVDIGLTPKSRIEAHACLTAASVTVTTHMHHAVSIHGSFEQIRYLLAAWQRQLDALEAEAVQDQSKVKEMAIA